jgi:flagellar motor switch protein FliM
VAVQGVAKFLASPGSIKGQKAIQVESAVPILPSVKPPAVK